MPTYHFDYRDKGNLIADPVGTPLESFEEAMVEAVRALAGLAKDMLGGTERRELAIEVRNEGGPVFKVMLKLGDRAARRVARAAGKKPG